MNFVRKIIKQAEETKNKLLSLYQKQKNQQNSFSNYSYRHIDQNKDLLRSSLYFSTYAPLIVESYIILYGLYVIYTIVKTIILIPIQIILGIIHIPLKWLKQIKTKYITMHSLVILACVYTFTLNQDIFDISYMYHLIRGQSTVKVYAIIFALQSSQVVLTKLGVFLHQNIEQKLTDKDVPFYKLFPQFIIESLYVFFHAYFIYIDYLIYSVVLNSSLQSFIIFWSVVYLTKMKSTPSFGLDINKYKANLTQDAKYRVSRIIYLVLFQLSQIDKSIPSMGYKFIFIVFVEELFIIIKHMIYLLSSYKGIHDTNAITIRQQMYKNMYLHHEKSSLDRCIQENMTILPFVVFCIKIVHILIYSNWEPNLLAYFTFYIMFCILGGFLIVLIISVKFIEEKAQQMRKKHQATPFVNSLCFEVIGKIIQEVNLKNSVQQKNRMDTQSSPDIEGQNDKQQQKSYRLIRGDSSKQIADLQSPKKLKIKRTTSIWQKMMIHASPIQNNNQNSQKKSYKQVNEQRVKQQENEDLTDQEGSKVNIRRSQSHI